MLTITYYVHGTTTDNEAGKATGWLPGTLSELGIRQSKELGAIVRDKPFAAVFSSDLQRAVDSARLSFGSHCRVITDRRLREVNYGDWNGQSELFKDHLVDYISKPFPNGESYQDVEKRLRDFLGDVKKKYDGQVIAVMGHQAPQLALEVLCNHTAWEQAIERDWRRTKAWQPGWEYVVS